MWECATMSYRRGEIFAEECWCCCGPPLPCEDFFVLSLPQHAHVCLAPLARARARHRRRLKVVEELVTKPIKANLEARTDQVNVAVCSSLQSRPRRLCWVLFPICVPWER